MTTHDNNSDTAERPRILVIDDDPLLRKTLGDILGVKGFDVVKAENGAAGLARAKTELFNVVVVDLRLPDISGIEVMSKVKAGSSATEVIILTGNATLDSAIDATNKGAFSYLLKPCEMDQLLLQIRRALERQQAEATIKQMAYYDPLTGLPNRLLFNDRLTVALNYAERERQRLALMMLDLDHFKSVNDSMGHDMGDQLLQLAAERLTNVVRKSDTVARLGGDEFTVLLPQMSHGDDAAMLANKILNVFHPSFVLAGQEFYISTSIGIAFYPEDGNDPRALMKSADTALYHAKEQNRNNYKFFTQRLNEDTEELIYIENGLRKALENDELVLHYQPQVDLTGGQVIGVEALLRWEHPDMGLVSPLKFIHVAEKRGLMVPIGEWVLKSACAQGRVWQEAGFPRIRMAVNLSGCQLRDYRLVELVKNILEDTSFDPNLLELELTESILIEANDTTLQTLQKLHDMGICISIDDFGTGYSSLSYLQRLPIHKLKIAYPFVKSLPASPNDKAIVGAIVGMARSLQLRTIAEGVETAEQMETLKSMGCDEMQGFLFSPALAPEEATILLSEDRHLPR